MEVDLCYNSLGEILLLHSSPDECIPFLNCKYVWFYWWRGRKSLFFFCSF